MTKNLHKRLLRNEQGELSARLTRRQRSVQFVQAALVIAYIWILRWTCRIQVVQGREHLDAALARGVFIPCGWHQRLLVSGLFLLTLQPRGVKVGFLISPSRTGEFIARVARGHRTRTLRGSSTRSGREAILAMTRGLNNGISPMIFPDGPKGPPGTFKAGAVVLARRTGVPLLIIGCAADRYWQLSTWDRTCVPKPFSRLNIAVGALRDPSSVTGRAEPDMAAAAAELDALTAVAEQHTKRG